MKAPGFDPFPLLATQRMNLRAFTKADAGQMHRLRSNREVMRLIDRPLTDSVESAGLLIESILAAQVAGEAVMWAMSLKNDPEIIGCICFVGIETEHQRADVGYLLEPRYHRQGLMSEALDRVVRYGLTELGFHKIRASVHALNPASLGLLEKNGFVREAHYRQHFFWNGHFMDTVELARFSPAAEKAMQAQERHPITDVHA